MPPASYPPHVVPLLTLAAQALSSGRPGDALWPLREAARCVPGDAGILHDLGVALLECGQMGEAIRILQGAIAADPAFADSHLRLGVAFEMADAPEEALAAYRRARALQPALADASYREGHLLESLGRTTPAAAAFRRAAAAAPGTTLGLIAAARALLANNRDGEAEKKLRQALVREPDNAVALELLGNTLAEAGRFAEARECLGRAIDRAPWLAGSYYDMVRCRRIGPEDGELMQRMHAALALPGLHPVQRSRIELALGKAASDLGKHEEAMRHFDAAEILRNGVNRFDLSAFEARVARLIARFGTGLSAVASAGGHGDPVPIFIVGLPRSGTTLLEQILSAHPRVAAAGELPFWNERGLAWEQAGGDEPDATLRATLARDYLRSLRSIAPRAAYVTDKMPFNFQWAGLIHAALPHAMIIHCRRNLLDTALSIHQTHFNVHMAFPTGGEALVGYVRAYQRLVSHWQRLLPPERFIEIDYEALVETPEPVIRQLLAACGLAWEEACLHPDRNRRVVKTPSKWQARQPIYKGAVGRWRCYEPWLGSLRVLLE